MAGAAFAADAPAPDCSGVQFTDEAGDQAVAPQGVGLPVPAPDNLDIVSGFLTVDGSKAFANLQVTNLDDETAPGADGARWYFFFTIGDQDLWVRSDQIGSDIVY